MNERLMEEARQSEVEFEIPTAAGAEEQLALRLRDRLGLRRIVGCSASLGAALQQAALVARHPVVALITGETGTGKEAFARAIHYLSSRSERQFLPVNCGAVPTELVENEFFGHASGAYTGASRASEGLVAQAEGGTLFLDEVDSLPSSAQVKLLRFLQEKEFRPVGSTQTRKADVRLIAAANSDLPEAVQQGRFRADLFYRLNVMPIALPPLRDRHEDIPLLAAHFVERYATEYGVACRGLSAAALARLRAYAWPGNIRELENVIQRAVLTSSGIQVEAWDLTWGWATKGGSVPVGGPGPNGDHGAAGGTSSGGDEGSGLAETFRALKARAVAAFEKEYLTALLRAHQGNITRAAKAAGKNRRALWELLRKHRLTTTAHSDGA